MKTRIITILLTALFLFTCIIPAYSQNAERLFQKGLMQEEGEGNLLEAINIYNSIVENQNAEQSIQAKALLHVGLCYEKMGKDEATKAYQKLVNNFPSQKNEVAIARERLSRLILAESKTEEVSLLPKWTKINIPTELSWAVKLSPDGKKLAHIADKKLWITPLSGNVGPNIPGTPVQLNTDGIEVEWTGLDWSKDGKWIAFNDYPKHDENGEYIKNQSIFIIPSVGGIPKKVIENYRDVRVVNYRISLSVNANKLAFSSIEENKQHIYTTSIDNMIPKQLVEMEAREPVFSADEKYIAFVKDKNKGIGSGDLGLWVVETNGGTPHKLSDAGKASSPVWSPDGQMIAYLDYSVGTQLNVVPFSKTENNNDRVIRIDAPKGTNEVRLLAGWTPDNKIGALVVSKLEFGLYTLPSEGGQAALVLHDNQAMQPRWSRDGSQIYYVDTPKEGEDRSYRRYIASIPSSGGKSSPLLVNIDGESIKQFAYQSGNRISPDGKWIVTSTWTPADTNTLQVHWPTSKIWKVSVDGEDAIQITNTPGNFSDMSPSWSPDGKKVAFVRFELAKDDIFGGDSKIYSINSEGGEPEPLVSIAGKYVNSVIWSPDGKMIAYLTKEINQPHTKNLNIYEFEKKESRILNEVQAGTVNNEVVWSPDSKRIAFNDAEGKVIKVMNIENGTIEDINTGLIDVNIYHLDWSPDGERFVFGGMKGGEAEFWFLENFLPLDKLAQNNETEVAKEPEGITIKQVWTGSDVENSGNVSSDGKYLSFIDWGTGNIAIRNLLSKENEVLTNDGTWEDPIQFADLNLISPNGKYIAYMWYVGNDSTNLGLVNLNNNITKILSGTKNGEVYPVAWFSDSKRLIVQAYDKSSNPIKSNFSIYNISDDEAKTIKKLDDVFMANISLSHDEKYFAYDFPVSDNDYRFDINLLSIDGKEELSLIKHPANDRLLGFLPNRNEFLFVSDRSGTPDVWVINTSDKNSINEPKRILTNVGNINPLGFSENGTLYYSTLLSKYNSYIVPYNQNSGNLSLNMRTPLLGSIGDVSWLPDKESILCIEFNRKSNNRQDYKLCVFNPETNEKQIICDNIIVMGPPRLSPDKKSVLIQGWEEKRIGENGYRGGIYMVDIKTGNPIQIKVIQDISRSYSNEWSKDGKSIFYTSNNQIIRHEISSGKEDIVYSNINLGSTVLRKSFEGNSLLFDIQLNDSIKHLKSISENGENEKVLAKFRTSHTPLNYKKLTLSPDGDFIYFTVDNSEGGSILWQIPNEGGEPKEILHSKYKIAGVNIHPDGKRMALSVYEQETEIRTLENLANELDKIYSQNE